MEGEGTGRTIWVVIVEGVVTSREGGLQGGRKSSLS